MADHAQQQIDPAGLLTVALDAHGQAGGGVAPTVTLISPSPGNQLAPNQPVIVDVTDPDSPFRRIFIVAVLGGVAYLAYDGTWRSGFAAHSSRSTITDGYRFSIRRDSGWTSAVDIEVYPIDDTGNEGS